MEGVVDVHSHARPYLEVPALKDPAQDEVGLGQALLHGEVGSLPDLVERVDFL